MTPLTSDGFDAFVVSHKLVVVHFWARWNGYDAEMTRLLEEEAPAQIQFGAVDTDQRENWELCTRLDIRNLPFLAFYREGALVATLTGVQKDKTLDQLRNLVGPGSQ